MSDLLIEPNVDRVKLACAKFNGQNEVVEKALAELFALFPTNDDPAHVLLKVVTLNRLYSTQILAVHDVATHIVVNSKEIDRALEQGTPEIADRIAKVEIKGAIRNNFSFASKYCSWHNESAYPIWDSRVDIYLRRLQREKHFCPTFGNANQWDYPKFKDVMVCLSKVYDLGSLTFKEIDKFIWWQGESAPEA